MTTCPICRKPTEHRYRPFCSRRCAEVDLARWLNGSYVIPGSAEDEGTSRPDDTLPDEPGSRPS